MKAIGRYAICVSVFCVLSLSGCGFLGLTTTSKAKKEFEKGKSAGKEEALNEEVPKKANAEVQRLLDKSLTALHSEPRKVELRREKAWQVDEDYFYSLDQLLGSLWAFKTDSGMVRYSSLIDSTLLPLRKVQTVNRDAISYIINNAATIDIGFLEAIKANLSDSSRLQIKHDHLATGSLDLGAKTDSALKAAKANFYTSRDSSKIKDFLFVTNIIVDRVRLKRFDKTDAGAAASYLGLRIDGSLYTSNDVETENYLIFIKGILLSDIVLPTEKNDKSIVAIANSLDAKLTQSSILTKSLDPEFPAALANDTLSVKVTALKSTINLRNLKLESLVKQFPTAITLPGTPSK